MPESLPKRFGNYFLLERIGVGGMAELFKAKAFGAEGFQRLVALKRLLPERAADQQFIDMFLDEATITVELSHANIVQVYELGRVEDTYYMTMQYVAGRDLRKVLAQLGERGQKLPVSHAVFIATAVCAALDYAHNKRDVDGRPLGIIHRDVSPHNIMVGYDGSVRVLDFGIARAVHRIAKTQAGVLKGKAAYMSPQQARYEKVDHRADVFAIGAVLWEMLAGQRLFVGKGEVDVLHKVRHGELRQLRSYAPDLPQELEAVVTRALAFDPDQRFTSAGAFADALQPYLIDSDGQSMASALKLAKLMRVHFGAEADAERVNSGRMLRLKTEAEVREEELAPTQVRPRRREMVVLATREIAALEPEDGVGWSPDDTGAVPERRELVPPNADELVEPPPGPVTRRERALTQPRRSWWPLVAALTMAALAGAAIAVVLLSR